MNADNTQPDNSENEAPKENTPPEPAPQPAEKSAENAPPVPPTPPPPKEPPQAQPVTEQQITESKKIVTQPITRHAVPTPGTPPAPPKQADGGMDRRSFIKWLSIGWASFAAIVAGYGAMTLRYLFPNVLFEPKQSFRAGFPEDYQVGQVSERWKAAHAVWLVRDSEKIYVLSTTCTHLGCTPNWLENDGKFKCPCHGSGFYKTGINFEGPAPRPLERFKISLNDDGEIVVDKTKKFQQEKGEWSDPESFLMV